jgi:hypothetical protein
MFVVAPIVGVGSAVVAFVVANDQDYPPAQMAVAILSGVVTLAWLFRWTRNRLGRGARGAVPASRT